VPELVERFAITATGMTSGMLSLLAERSAGRWQPGTLRRVLYGGAPLAEADMRRAVEVVGPVLVQVYGRLEGGWPLTVLSPFDHDAILAGDGRLARSCGRAIDPHVELRLRPVAGAGDASGELGTRSAMVVGEYADPDGWCQLGDLARRDDDGYVFLEGRLDDMINTGYHVYPAQVEEALLSLAGVRGARVRGEPDAKRGEAIAAYVVSDGEQDADALRERLRALLAPYKIPHRISFVASLPVR
jgi:acyl-coenzyme A synthetase/AMP-(fatty) acid ligase